MGRLAEASLAPVDLLTQRPPQRFIGRSARAASRTATEAPRRLESHVAMDAVAVPLGILCW